MKKPAKKAFVQWENVVADPRYGSRPMISGERVDEVEIRKGHWQYQDATIFAESVQTADLTKQNFSIYPRRYYVDMLQQCRTCHRPFLFFAKEQRHWFEVLGFQVDANCVHCAECREAQHQLSRQHRRYSALIKLQRPTALQFVQLIDAATALINAGQLRNYGKLQPLKHKALKEIGQDASTAKFIQALETLRTEKPIP